MEIKKQRKRLKTMSDLRRYLANLINETASGRIEPSLGGKLIYMLNTLKGIISDGDLEERVCSLEKEIQDRR